MSKLKSILISTVALAAVLCIAGCSGNDEPKKSDTPAANAADGGPAPANTGAPSAQKPTKLPMDPSK